MRKIEYLDLEIGEFCYLVLFITIFIKLCGVSQKTPLWLWWPFIKLMWVRRLPMYHFILIFGEPIHFHIYMYTTNLPEIQTQLGTTHDAPECERCHKGIHNKGAYNQTTPEIVYVYFLRIIESESTVNRSVFAWAYMVFKYMIQCVIVASQLVGYENK